MEVVMFVSYHGTILLCTVTEVSRPWFTGLDVWLSISLAFLFIEDLCLQTFCSGYTGNKLIAPRPAIRCWVLRRTGCQIIFGTGF